MWIHSYVSPTPTSRRGPWELSCPSASRSGNGAFSELGRYPLDFIDSVDHGVHSPPFHDWPQLVGQKEKHPLQKRPSHVLVLRSPAGRVCRRPTDNSYALFCRGPPRSRHMNWTLPPLPQSWSEVEGEIVTLSLHLDGPVPRHIVRVRLNHGACLVCPKHSSICPDIGIH